MGAARADSLSEGASGLLQTGQEDGAVFLHNRDIGRSQTLSSKQAETSEARLGPGAVKTLENPGIKG